MCKKDRFSVVFGCKMVTARVKDFCGFPTADKNSLRPDCDQDARTKGRLAYHEAIVYLRSA
jgi:hypothetical protein